MSEANSIAWPFSFKRTLLIVAFDVAAIALVGTTIAFLWSLT